MCKVASGFLFWQNNRSRNIAISSFVNAAKKKKNQCTSEIQQQHCGMGIGSAGEATFTLIELILGTAEFIGQSRKKWRKSARARYHFLLAIFNEPRASISRSYNFCHCEIKSPTNCYFFRVSFHFENLIDYRFLSIADFTRARTERKRFSQACHFLVSVSDEPDSLLCP